MGIGGASGIPAGPDRGAGIRAMLTAGVIAVGGVFAASQAMRWVAEVAMSDSAERLDRLASRVGRTVEQRFGTPVYGLRGLRAAYAANGEMSRSQFRDWVASRDLGAEFPGVRAFAYAEHVYRWSTIRFVERTKRDGLPDFAIRSQGDAPDLYVVKYIEPFAGFETVPGADIGAEPARRTAIDAAIETGGAALTEPVGLAGVGSRPVPGFLLMLAVYDGGAVPETVAARREAARGILYVPILIDELVSAAAGAGDGFVEFDLFDGLPDGTIQPFYSYRAPGSAVPVPASVSDLQQSFFVPMVISNRLIVLRAWGTPQWEAGVDRTTQMAVGAGISALSFGLAFVVWLVMTDRARALALAQGMTADLDRLAAIAERTTNGVVIAGPDRRIVWVNEGFTRLTGYSAAEAVGRKPRELLQFDGTWGERDGDIRRALVERRPFRGEIRNRAKDGRAYWVDLEIRPMLDRAGSFTGYMAIQSDITERKEAFERLKAHEAELQKAFVDVEEARFRAESQAMEMTALAEQLSGERQRSELAHSRLKEAIESLSDGFCLYDPDARIVMLNERYTRTYGSFADLIVPGTSYEFVVRLGLECGLYPAAKGREGEFVREHMESFRNPGQPYEVRGPDGRWNRIEKKRTPSGHTIIFRIDITQLKEKESVLAAMNAELERLATTDPLTGAPNRRSLVERGNAEILRLKRYPGSGALLALDIDHFKRVNDTYGHAAGDRVLVEFARRVRANLRESDMFGRIGGEEFAVVAPNTDLEGAKLLAARLLEAVRASPIDWEGTGILITTSIGISMIAAGDADLSAPLGRADEALYRVKNAGRNRYEFA